MNQVQIVEVTEEHKVYYALEPEEKLSNAVLELLNTHHTRVPVNSKRIGLNIDSMYSVPFDSELLNSDYRDMIK
jgi:hypothetical protein